jgi:hypothetical protein
MRTAIRAVLAAALAWCVGAAAAVTLGVVGVSLIGATLTDTAAPSQSPTAEQSARPDGTISSPTALASPSSPASAQPSTPTSDKERLISSPGGTVLARCSAAGASLGSVTPAPGYRATRVSGGSAPEATVTFQSGQGQVEVVLRCLAGVPHATIHHAGVTDDVGDD